MGYSTLDQAKDEGQREQDALDTAASLVQRWAPAPDPEPALYAAKAARAERAVFRYLLDTKGGYLTAESLSGVDSSSYSLDLAPIQKIVREEMGAYYTGGGGRVVSII